MPSGSRTRDGVAVRVAAGDGDALAPEAVAARARELGVMGWVRAGAESPGLVHAEGEPVAVAALVALLGDAAPARARPVAVEGHEQFAIRGVVAGVFVVAEHLARTRHFDLRLQLGDSMRSWALPRGPSLDPAIKRLAVQVADHAVAVQSLERVTAGGAAIVWDRGSYEQGGRVGWPEALDRGHAVFVLHGEKLRGGFALQRTRGGPKRRGAHRGGATPAGAASADGEGAQWLLIKRRDGDSAPGSEIAVAQPRSVVSGLTLDELSMHARS
ncbi:MAG: DNA polymerase ligase N-terminal domain-containing protein [Solirubrobacteraceae bacterium]